MPHSFFRCLTSFLACIVTIAPTQAAILRSLSPSLINHYTFDDPLVDGFVGNEFESPVERDLGRDATAIQLLNGAPRIADGAWGQSRFALETAQVSATPTNDDWKAGVFFESSAASTLASSNHVAGLTLMGWFKPLGDASQNPSPNTNTTFSGDYFNAFGLFGILRGDEGGLATDGHAARALIEVIDGKLVALGRRLDSQPNAARAQTVAPWHQVLVPGQWSHITAVFDYDGGSIALYRNGLPVATQTLGIANWQTTPGVDLTSASNAGGIKIGGSHPNNTME
ncbi:MAG: hypothetical protein KDA61_10275, partial [Planctomycetales bacterium]|nr:hypothetical protein [Planctomycetales bacterium]